MRRLLLCCLPLATLSAQAAWTAVPPLPNNNAEVHLCPHDADHRVVCLASRRPGSFFETWEWDGRRWYRRQPAASLPWRQGPALVYDAARRVIVAFGGLDGGNTMLSDTWEWDGLSWTQRQPATAPPPRYLAAMAYDTVRQRVVLYGGSNASGTFGDLWEWDGTTWTQRTPGGPAPPAANVMLAFDEARGVTVLCPHQLAPTLEVWEYDGVSWSHPTPAFRPPGLYGAKVAYDPDRGRTVLYSGYVALAPSTDFLEWDGVQWHSVSPVAPLAFRTGTGFAYDRHARRFILQGGGDFVETWTFDATPRTWTRVGTSAPVDVRSATSDWAGNVLVMDLRGTFVWNRATLGFERLQPATPPPIMAHLGLAFDVQRDEAVLLGAVAGGTETWRWLRQTREWTRSTATSPPYALGGTMAYDIARGQMIFFGGILDWLLTQQFVADTWMWNGNTWTQLSPPTAPSARAWAAMTFDPTTGGLVLFGGQDASSALLDDVWDWDGTTWAQRPISVPGPSARSTHSLLSRVNGVTVVGGHDGASLDDVWLLQGSQWSPAPSAGLPALAQVVAAGDPIGDELVVFSGSNPIHWPTTGAWLFAVPPALVTPFGGGCGAGGETALTARDRPVLGSTVQLHASGLAPSQPAMLVLGASTQLVQLPASCRFFVVPDAPLLVASSTLGTVQVALPLPGSLALVGAEAHAQVFALDPATGFALTPALTLRVGGP